MSRFLLSPFLLCLLPCFLLSACYSGIADQQQIREWQGQNIQAVKDEWGKPDTVLKLSNGHVVYQYTRKTFYNIPNPHRSATYINSNRFTSYYEPWHRDQTRIRFCRARFETDKHGDIMQIHLSGHCF